MATKGVEIVRTSPTAVTVEDQGNMIGEGGIARKRRFVISHNR